ncbi:hypothetical protein Moror_8827 [Moniliophthora roreri MCA 2997]|uniref:Chromatin target of PRMT1 protein C-terminal domain-containing protein n=2 Tax=Moniliophthora roreri TaxID=221103 RepID=V2YN33_MONRO|nr:hypothetical protein Moror_8827 [Moniliophthora roreri MCA 2997]KAI3604487.1 hypothetical protein WG66_008541 [Moniliophthora roreri]
MDVADFETQDPSSLLSYDDDVAYEDQHSTSDAGLASRIGKTKVYLLSESSIGKRKRGDGEQTEEEVREDIEDIDMNEDTDTNIRNNAILLQGTPISHLPTARLFAYATHFDAHPMGLEWIDDNTCVLVFESKVAAHQGYKYLQRLAGEAELDGFVTAKPIPMAFWPPEERINKSLGKGEGLKGTIRMRWAKVDDVKKKGAKQESEFYRKHGNMAGKELFNGRETQGAAKRRKMDDTVDLALQKERLDRELDSFLDEEAETTPEPPSKMRSDYIASDGRTLLERTSVIRAHPDAEGTDLASRITAPLPRRARRSAGGGINLEDRLWSDERVDLGSGDVREKRGRRNGNGRASRGSERKGVDRSRPKKTQQELDDELDAFLQQKD